MNGGGRLGVNCGPLKSVWSTQGLWFLILSHQQTTVQLKNNRILCLTFTPIQIKLVLDSYNRNYNTLNSYYVSGAIYSAFSIFSHFTFYSKILGVRYHHYPHFYS